ncbi:hypothetical protein GUJ93_ZPchr0007g4072 [Zizania palustris]|uniref:Uncharacterized protein n=1 Tax=Zizania palustris TaxID=103762 RepID=A0A8J5W6M5_ZIZPA|nr:hypothetical protein GUJ93_ZPchr0007g4072 [Zizania palustris]
MALNLVLHCIQPCKSWARLAYDYEGWANPSHEFPEALAMKEAYFSNEDAPKSYRLKPSIAQVAPTTVTTLATDAQPITEPMGKDAAIVPSLSMALMELEYAVYFDNCGVGAEALLKMVDDEPSCAVM